MDGYELINFEEIEDNIKFDKFIIEYFKNDYLMIVDFLKDDSAWDNSIMMLLECTKDELFEYKSNMVDNIIDVYTTVVMSTVQRQTEEVEEFNSVDGPYINHINNKEMPITIFLEDDFCAIQMLRYFINVVDYKYDVKIDTYNTFKYDILEILRIYEELAQKIGIDRYEIEIDDSLEKKYVLFFQYLYKNITDYVNNFFRNDKEREMFINYLFSISFAYIKDLSLYEDEYTEEDELFVEIMSEENNLLDIFYDNQSLATYVIELCFQCYLNYQLGYDLRKSIKEDSVQEIFEKLDENYNTTYDTDIVVNTCDLDLRLKNILDSLYSKFSIEEIYNILLNNITMYDFLLEQKLDARHSEYYKKQILIKIISDVFEYEVYRKKIDEDYKQIHYINIKNLKNDEKSILEYFLDNGYSLLSLYYEYYNEIITYHERAKLEVINTKNLNVVNRLSDFSLFNYLYIFNIKTSGYVDYLNDLYNKIKNVVKTKDINIILDEDEVLLVNSLCLNIYINILSLDKLTLEESAFLKLIDNNDIVIFVRNNPEYLLDLCKLFIKYNDNYLSYVVDSKLKKNIKSPEKIKIISKFNKFND